MSGTETEVAQRLEGQRTVEFEMRYNLAMTNKVRLTWQSRTFDVLSVRDVDEMHHTMIITCREVI